MDRIEAMKECQAIVWEIWGEDSDVPETQECLRNAFTEVGVALQEYKTHESLANCAFWLITAAGRDAEVNLTEFAPSHASMLEELAFWVALLLTNHSIGAGTSHLWDVVELISLYPGLDLAEMLRKLADGG